LAVGETRQLDASDLPHVPSSDLTERLQRGFQAAWRGAEAGPRRLARAILTLERDTIWAGARAKLAHDTILFAAPAALNALLQHLSSSGEAPPPRWARAVPPDWRGACYVALLLGGALSQTLLLAQYFHQGYRAGCVQCWQTCSSYSSLSG